MDAKQFIQAVWPVVLADVVLSVIGDLVIVAGIDDSLGWVLAGVSLLVLPLWAGARMSRFSTRWTWWCIGGLTVLASTATFLLIREVWEPLFSEVPLMHATVAFLVLIPFYALFGFIGGRFSLTSRTHAT